MLFIMTKIYIQNYNLELIKNKYDELQPHYKKQKIEHKLYSDEGNYTIIDNNIIKNKPIDCSPIIINENKNTFILDNSFFKDEQIYSQIPYNHIIKEIVTLHYCIESSTTLYLVLEGYYKDISIFENTDNHNNTPTHNFVLVDFYFYTPQNIKDLDNFLIKKELNKFISIL